MQRFVREKGDDSLVEKKRQQSITVENGSVAREKYESVLRMPSTSTKTSTRSSVRKKRRTGAAPFDKREFFAAVTSNDVEVIERMNVNHRNVNGTDQFGWSALMMAACDGHIDVVKFLIRRGAKTDIEDKQKDTALSLAMRNKHQMVVNFLQKIQSQSDTICLDSDDDEPANGVTNRFEAFFCDVCQLKFTETDRKAHESSTLHRFNRPDMLKSARHFGIPESNIGYQMLLQQGWDRESGLGRERDGTIYPIKTTLRKLRSGLGIRQPNKPKVTHFKPFDGDAVKSMKPPTIQTVTTKKQIRAEKRKDERKNRYLRRILS